jgi:hypothetical protein
MVQLEKMGFFMTFGDAIAALGSLKDDLKASSMEINISSK